MPLSPLFQFSRQRRTSARVVPGSRPMNVKGNLFSSWLYCGGKNRPRVSRSARHFAPRRSGACDADRPHVVEELAEEVPPPSRSITADPMSRSPAASTAPSTENGSRLRPDVAQPLVARRPRPVLRVRGGGKPALVDASAMPAERIEIVGVQFQAAPRQHKRARHPSGLEPQNSRTRVDRVLCPRACGRYLGRHGACDLSLLTTSLQAPADLVDADLQVGH